MGNWAGANARPGRITAAGLRNAVRASLAIVLALLLLGGTLTWESVKRTGKDYNRVTHSYQVLDAALDLGAAVGNIENSRELSLWDPSVGLEVDTTDKRATVQSILGTLQALTVDNPAQQTRLKPLKDSIATWLKQSDDLLLTHRKEESATEAAPSTQYASRGTFESILVQISQLEAVERALLAQRAEHAQQDDFLALTTVVIATVSSIALIIVAFLLMRRNDSVRQQSEAELRESQTRYSDLVEHLPSAILVVQGGQIKFANETAFALIGAPTSERLVGHEVTEFAGPDDPAAEQSWRRCDGTLFPCNVQSEEILWNGDPAVLFMLGDLTAIRTSEAARRHTETRLAAVVASAMDGIISMDAQQRIVLFNPAAERMFGIRAAEIIGRPLNALLPVRFRAIHPVHVERLPLGGISARQMTPNLNPLAGLRANGEEFPIEASISHAAVDEDTLFTVVVRDISERVRRAEDLRIAQERINHMGRLSTMGEIAGGLSHELNQPLTAIASYAQALARSVKNNARVDDADLVDITEQIAAQALRAGEVIRRMNAMIRNQVPRFGYLECGRLLEDIRALIAPDARINEVSLEFDVQDPVCTVHGNAVQLQQVLLNLVRNAIEAVQSLPEEKRHVRVYQCRTSDLIRIEVRDQGSGVPSHVIDNLFRPFFTTKGNGTGLGLAISRTIIASHGGQLTYESAADGGAIFQVILPFPKEHAA
jgi:two-component system sensor kinase FixL